MTEPVRILHVITRMVRGGAQENTLSTVLGIEGHGWRSSLVTGPSLGPEGSLEPRCMAAGVRMVRIPELVRELSPRQDWIALRRLMLLFRKERPHLVHTHTSKAGVLGRIAARRSGVPVIVHTPHGHVFHSYEGRLKTRIFVAAERFCAGLTDRLIALTSAELREHREMGIGASDQWLTVHSGVDFAPFEGCRSARAAVRTELGLSPDAAVLGTVGRLVPVKGQAYLIDAFASVAAGDRRLQLLLVGDGPLRTELIDRARAGGLAVAEHAPGESAVPPAAPTVHFVGLRTDVPRLLSAMDLFVLPSLNEGMGRALVEAMALELPCVASNVSGIPDVIQDGVSGLLVPARDAASLATAIRSLLEQPERARELGCRGRERVIPEFGEERMVQKLQALYRELLERGGIRVPCGPQGT